MKILTLKDEKNDDLYFSYNLLSAAKIEMLGHARHYISIVQPTSVYAPKLEEQQKISSMFKDIDSLITLHHLLIIFFVFILK